MKCNSKSKKAIDTRIISGMVLCWERKPIRYEMNVPQVVTVIIVAVVVFSCNLISGLTGRDTVNIPKVILGVHGFISRTV